MNQTPTGISYIGRVRRPDRTGHLFVVCLREGLKARAADTYEMPLVVMLIER